MAMGFLIEENRFFFRITEVCAWICGKNCVCKVMRGRYVEGVNPYYIEGAESRSKVGQKHQDL
jgi:hypothetical protein